MKCLGLLSIIFAMTGSMAYGNDNFKALNDSLGAFTSNGSLPLKLRGSIVDLNKFRELKAEEYRREYEDSLTKLELQTYVAERVAAITGICVISAEVKNKRDSSQELRIDLTEIEADGSVGIRRDLKLNSQINAIEWEFSKPEPNIDQLSGSAQGFIGSGTKTLQIVRKTNSFGVRVIQTARGPLRRKSTSFECEASTH